jgi:threonine dehydrogenase-like Zn-dependent dehydrogenase
VAVWGCGPVGQFAIQSAFLLGAERVIAIDRFPSAGSSPRRTASAGAQLRAVDVSDALREMTGGRAGRLHRRGGPRSRTARRSTRGTTARRPSMYMATDRPACASQAISACRKGGTVSIPGVYGGGSTNSRSVPAFAKGLTLQDGSDPHAQVHAATVCSGSSVARSHRPSSVTHRVTLDQAPEHVPRRSARKETAASRS